MFGHGYYGVGYYGPGYWGPGASTTTPDVDTHDGVDDIHKREAKRNRKIVEAKRKLRQTIADLIDGPRTETEPVIVLPPPELENGVSDADVERWLEEIEQWKELVKLKRAEALAILKAKEIEDDDEDIIMLAGL